MKSLICFLFVALASSPAFAICGKYYSTAEKAGERLNELLRLQRESAGRNSQLSRIYQAAKFSIVVTPKNVPTPCADGNDHYSIEINGVLQLEGDREGAIGG